MADGEASELIGQITEAAVNLVNANVDLVSRLAAGSSPEDLDEGTGPFRDVWMTWAEGAGDLVRISYLSAQLLDVITGFDRRRAD
jgi:hypothetical protein